MLTHLDIKLSDSGRLVELAGLFDYDLTSTPLERELAARLDALLAEQRETEEGMGERLQALLDEQYGIDRHFAGVLDESGLDGDDFERLVHARIGDNGTTVRMLELLDSKGIDSLEALERELDLVDRIRGIASDDATREEAFEQFTQLLNDINQE